MPGRQRSADTLRLGHRRCDSGIPGYRGMPHFTGAACAARRIVVTWNSPHLMLPRMCEPSVRDRNVLLSRFAIWSVSRFAIWSAALALSGSIAAGPLEDWSEVMAASARGDHAMVVRLTRSLAEGGDADAQYDLGVLFHVGEDLPQDYVQAWKWYAIAAARFSPEDQTMRERAIKNRDRIGALMSPAQLVEARRLAAQWRPD
jgi:hypothetical protein